MGKKKNNSKAIVPQLSELGVYDGGNLNEITTGDLINNEVAIKQLINTYNIKISELKTASETITTLTTEVEFLKTTPFISIISMIINLLGSTVSSIAVNLLSTPEQTSNYAIPLLIIGFALVVVGSLFTILYPYAKNMFNKK